MKLKTILLLITYSLLLTTFLGCEAFRKKFVRKAKREEEVKIVTQTQEYESMSSLKQIYQKYFAFCQAWHEELINLIDVQNANRKRVLFSAEKIVENLEQMRQLLLPEKQKKLSGFISAQKKIIQQLDRRKLSRGQRIRLKSNIEKQKRQIQKEFNYRHIQKYLIER